MTGSVPDVTTTLFRLPADAKVLTVGELAPRIRARLGVVRDDHAVLTRPGHRVTTQLMPAALAGLVQEFHEASRLTDAVLRFARRHEHDPFDMLDLSIDALAALVDARLLVPEDAPDVTAPAPSLAAGQAFADFAIDALVRALDDSEVYRGHDAAGVPVALKVARDARPHVALMLAREADVLERLGGLDTPRLHSRGTCGGRAYIAMEWCDGVSIAVAGQQARATGDRRRIRDLIARVLQAYARLHARGMLHGDVHPGNCLVRDDGRIVLLDFGHARPVTAPPGPDVTRVGLPQFYDPQTASALLAGALPPAVNLASEQYAVAVLAYLLVTGWAPVDAPAVHDVLLRRIAERPPLPFAARGVAAWPGLETTLSRALARAPAARFSSISDLAAAVARVPVPPRPRSLSRAASAGGRVFRSAVDAARALSTSVEPRDLAWFALRAALASDDPTLLAAADVLVSRATPTWSSWAVTARIARARSDARLEARALEAFVTAADREAGGRRLVCAADLVTALGAHGPVAPALARWLGDCPGRLGEAAVYAHLRLTQAGALELPPTLLGWLEHLSERHGGSVGLWGAAFDVTGDTRHRHHALTIGLPRAPAARAYAMLRRHQLTGDRHWVERARRVTSRMARSGHRPLETATLMADMAMPAVAVAPPFLEEVDGQPMR